MGIFTHKIHPRFTRGYQERRFGSWGTSCHRELSKTATNDAVKDADALCTKGSIPSESKAVEAAMPYSDGNIAGQALQRLDMNGVIASVTGFANRLLAENGFSGHFKITYEEYEACNVLANLNSKTNMVYKYLCGKSEDGLSVDVRTADIASELNISKRTAETSLAALRDAGLVRSAGSRRYPKILLNKV